MKNTLIGLIIFFAVGYSYSQDTLSGTKAVHRINIKSGIHKYYTRDATYSPLIYKGASVPINLEYFNSKEKKNYSVYLQFANTQATSSITGAKDGYYSNYFDYINLKLGFNYFRHFKTYSNWDIYLGGVFENYFLYKSQVFKYENSQYSVDFFWNLKLAVDIQKKINKKNLLQFNISYPLLAYVYMRVYAADNLPEKLLKSDDLTIGNLLTSGDFLTINDFVNYEFSTKYYLFLSKRFDLIFNYHFQLYRYTKPGLVKNGIHSLMLGAAIKM
jgi:hypothetical protein